MILDRSAAAAFVLPAAMPLPNKPFYRDPPDAALDVLFGARRLAEGAARFRPTGPVRFAVSEITVGRMSRRRLPPNAATGCGLPG